MRNRWKRRYLSRKQKILKGKGKIKEVTQNYSARSDEESVFLQSNMPTCREVVII